VTHVSLREEADCIYRTDGNLSTGYLVLEALFPTTDCAIGDPEQAVKFSTDSRAPIVAVQTLSSCYEFAPNHASRRAARLVERPLRHQPPSKRDRYLHHIWSGGSLAVSRRPPVT
jgi:hypothetical protein